MKIVICGSGTAGHFYPALELGEGLEKRGHSVYYVVNAGKIEEDELKKLNKQTILVKCQKVNFETIFFLSNKLKKLDIDIAIGFGGYISFCLIFGAFVQKIPSFIHEQNTIMGDANYLSKMFVKKVFTSFEKTEKAGKKYLYVGNPIEVKVRRLYPSIQMYDVIFVMGSLGSTSVNRVIREYLEKKRKKYKVLVVTGKQDYDDFNEAFSNRSDIVLSRYDNQLISHIKSCKLVVCRSGATTLCELKSCAKPAILVPSPYVKNNHQMKNAISYSKWGAAIIIEEGKLTADILANNIERLLENNKQLDRMIQAAKHYNPSNAVDKIIEVIESYE